MLISLCFEFAWYISVQIIATRLPTLAHMHHAHGRLKRSEIDSMHLALCLGTLVPRQKAGIAY